MRAFIIPGNVSHLAKVGEVLTDRVCGILIHQRINVRDVDLSGVRLRNVAGKVFTLNSLTAMTAGGLDEQDLSTYKKWLDYILSDSRVHFLATRSRFDSAFNNSAAIEKIAFNSLLIIRKTNPSCLISSSTPHSLEAWVFAKCFEYLALPVSILESTPVGLRSWIYSGLDVQKVELQQDVDGDATLEASSAKLLEEQRYSKPGARDKNGFPLSRIYMSSVAGSHANKWWSCNREARWVFSGKMRSLPLRLYSSRLKKILYDSYRKCACEQLPPNPFVVYFMHYQPERSSLPIALQFSQQWFAIRLLSMSLPEGWSLLVREHPSTWLRPLDISIRTKDLYQDISALENTELVSMDMDTFELIDGCTAVATLTGNVGFQAILRSKPAIVFGLASYKDHPACFSVSSYIDIVAALSEIKNDGLGHHFRDDAIRDYLLWIERNSFSVDSGETDPIHPRLSLSQKISIQDSDINLFSKLLL